MSTRLQNFYRRALPVLVYPANLVTLAVAAFTVTTFGVTYPALGAALAAGCVYEFACRRAGRRIGWPFDTPGARHFADIYTRAKEREAELAALREENERLSMVIHLIRSKPDMHFELVLADVHVTAARTVDDVIFVDVEPGDTAFVDVFDAAGTRHRVQFTPADDVAVLSEELASKRRELCHFTLRLAASPEAALLCSDLMERPGSLSMEFCGDRIVSRELADADYNRRFGVTRDPGPDENR